MFWEYTTIRQLVRLVTRPRPEGKATVRGSTGIAGDRCGCCPACRAFVRIGPADGRTTPCPGCGRPIRHLDPLWPGGPDPG